MLINGPEGYIGYKYWLTDWIDTMEIHVDKQTGGIHWLQILTNRLHRHTGDTC